ncbi:MAG: oligosaccharide flippase family protein [Deltaproteobacteria bacterium]|nr:oligosaccharide flippase family protein [Deltaproteobacteria bacterium]
MKLLHPLRLRLTGHSVLAYFAASSMAINGATLLAGVAALRWIPPELMGIWQMMLLAEGYASVLRMGIPNAMNRELPYFLGRGEEERGRQVAATALLHAILTGAMVFAGFAIAGLAIDSGKPGWQLAALARSIAAGTGFYFSYLTGTFRSNKSFKALAGIQLAQAGLALLMPVFAYAWGYNGFCLHAVLQSVILAGICHAKRPLRIRPAFHAEAWSLLWRTGFHLFISAYLLTLVRGLENVFLFRRGGEAMVGIFAPALAVSHAMEVLPAALSSYVYPRMSFRFGETSDASRLSRMTFWTMGLALALCVPLVLVGWVCLPWVVERLVPKYSAALPAMRIALLTGMLLSVITGTSVLRALKKWTLLYGFIALVGTAKLIAVGLMAGGDSPVMGVAWGGLVSAVVAAGAAVIACRMATRDEGNKAAA